MVATMREHGFLHRDHVAQAFLTAPRHTFAPEASLEAAYDALDIVRTKLDEHGATLSSVSAPYIQAMMLEQTDIRPGMRVLEIGSGGYQAALLAELVGPTGEVTTVDIDTDITGRATGFLESAGYPQVTVIHGDAEVGVAHRAPYDRTLVTAGAWDIPPAWTDQLTEHGRLVVPLRLQGLTRSVALERADGHWTSVDHQMCGFVPMQGLGTHHEREIAVHDDVRLRLDEDLSLDLEGLRAALLQPPVERWTGVTVACNEPFDGLHLWLATAIPGCGLLCAEQTAVDTGLVSRMARWGARTALDGASCAYHAAFRPNGDNTRHEFGIRAHGPHAERLAADYVELIQTWDHHYRNQQAHIDIYPATATVPQPPASRVLDKHHTRVLISWPEGSPT